MTYLDMLRYQERSMNDTLCQCWIGFRQDRDIYRLQLQMLRSLIARGGFAVNRDQDISDRACDRAAAKRHPMFRERW